MTCPKCKGLGSVVKANTSTGEFEILECQCQKQTKLLKKWFIESNQNRVYEIRHIEDGWIIVVEYYRNGECYKRQINQMLFEQNIEDNILLPFNKPIYYCSSCQIATADYLINHQFMCYNCKQKHHYPSKEVE